ncbi:MAG: hypothetical protein FH762_19790 [Firmicutes bacterium]|nr:hypothetical protein [Bacillota bacterium]
MLLLLIFCLLFIFTGCGAVQNNSSQLEDSKETQETAQQTEQYSEEMMIINTMINQLDEAAAFVVITVRNFVNVGLENPGGKLIHLPTVLNHMVPENFKTIISADGKNWGEVPQEENIDEFYVKCGYNSRDLETGESSRKIKVVMDRETGELKVLAGKNNQGIDWQEYCSGGYDDFKERYK